MENWTVHPGESRVIDLESARSLKVSLIGGQVDIVAHDAPEARIEVHSVTGKDLRITAEDGRIEVDHPQLRWDNFLAAFGSLGAEGPQTEISIAVPRNVRVTVGVASASVLLAGVHGEAKLNTMSGDVIVDGLHGDLVANAISGDVHARGVHGSVSVNSVSGDVAATGSILRSSIDTVSGAIALDALGTLYAANLNSVGGAITVRLDEDLVMKYAARTVSGRVQIDGVLRSESGPAGIVGSSRDSGEVLDLRAHSVSGDITILRRTMSGVT